VLKKLVMCGVYFAEICAFATDNLFERTTANTARHLEVGHAAQDVYLQVVGLDLGTVVIGAFRRRGSEKSCASE
jgi:nitroreductase